MHLVEVVLMTNIQEGDKAPDFTLKDKNEQEYKLSKIAADYTVVYFYPKDNTPGCTIEAKNFDSNMDKFETLNTQIIGISGQDEASKKKFCEKHDLNLLLLADSDFEVSKKYGVYGKKKFMGREYMGINRETFVLDKDKKVLKHYKKVKPKEHSEEVLEFIKNQ